MNYEVIMLNDDAQSFRLNPLIVLRDCMDACPIVTLSLMRGP